MLLDTEDKQLEEDNERKNIFFLIETSWDRKSKCVFQLIPKPSAWKMIHTELNPPSSRRYRKLASVSY
jgi:hypothetical protein